jgi:hypothetical protein
MSRIGNIVIFSSPNDLPNTTNFTNIDEKCSLIYGNKTGILIKDYDGIPENLILNLFAWLALVVLFTFLRYIGDYGRLGLLKSDEERYFSFLNVVNVLYVFSYMHILMYVFYISLNRFDKNTTISIHKFSIETIKCIYILK